jgi:uncharacterized protein YfaP (DUF2135 family)
MILLVAILALVAHSGPIAAQCTGDCDDDGAVAIDELITGVNIALGFATAGDCAAIDVDGDGQVAVNELVAAVAAALGTCADDSLTIVNFVQSVRVIDLGAAGVLRDGEPPAPAGGPSAAAPSSATVINGGSAQARVSADAPFERVFLSVEMPLSAGSSAGIQIVLVAGYFEIDLPAAVSEADVQIVIAPEVQEIADSFQWRFQVADAGGAAGEPALTDVGVVEVGSGDLQISVSWDSEADVDLHVIEPSGEEIYFADTLSETGGMLDLDALCFDEVRNENITWASGTAPRGRYVVRLVYYNECFAEQTNYVVTVRRSDAEPESFTGTFTGPGTREAAGGGITITEFDL